MAHEEKSKHEAKREAPKKKHLHAITTHKADDHTVVHEHHYRDEEGNSLPPSYGGVSTSLDDLNQHMADHMGDHFEQDQEPEPQDESASAPAAPPAGGGGPAPAPGQ